jgi:hypothetical protein
LKDALEAGKKAFLPSTTREELAAEFNRLTPSEQEMYRLGAANSLREKLAGKGPGLNKAREAYGSPGMVEKIRTIAPNEGAERQFAEQLTREQQMFETRHEALGNSKTAERLADDAESAKQAIEALKFTHAVGTGHLWEAGRIAMRHLAKVDPTARGHVLNAIREIALNPSPETVEAFARRIQAANLPSGVMQSVVGVVRNALNRMPRTLSTLSAGASNQ